MHLSGTFVFIWSARIPLGLYYLRGDKFQSDRSLSVDKLRLQIKDDESFNFTSAPRNRFRWHKALSAIIVFGQDVFLKPGFEWLVVEAGPSVKKSWCLKCDHRWPIYLAETQEEWWREEWAFCLLQGLCTHTLQITIHRITTSAILCEIGFNKDKLSTFSFYSMNVALD